MRLAPLPLATTVEYSVQCLSVRPPGNNGRTGDFSIPYEPFAALALTGCWQRAFVFHTEDLFYICYAPSGDTAAVCWGQHHGAPGRLARDFLAISCKRNLIVILHIISEYKKYNSNSYY